MRALNKSQLRRLASEYADGRIGSGEYRDRRRELIDAIVAGREAIRREAPPPRPEPVPLTQPVRQARSTPPWPLILGGAAAVLLVALLWLLWPADEAPPPPPPAAALPPPAEVPRSRTLVESFLALRDFSPAAVAAFQREWDELAESERAEARDTLWFRSLVRALRDEIKTQKALAGLAGGGAALGRAQQVWDFGAHLGVAEQLPPLEIEVAATPAQDGIVDAPDAAPAPDAEAPGAAPATDAEPPTGAPVSTDATREDDVPAAAPDAATDSAPAGTDSARAPTGREWLAAQSDETLTLQLFAVNHLDRVEQLMTAHPALPLHIVATDGAAPRYRVLHGAYESEAAARAGFDALPAGVSAAAGGAIVKSFAALREDLARHAEPAAGAPPGAAADAPQAYTLQLFASGNRDNAQALVDAFPDLALELHELGGDLSPYRVVYGRFASADDARAAAAVLPGNLLSRIGTPLPKALDETGVKVR